MICSFGTQEERQFLVISQRQWLILKEVVMEDDILLKSVVIVERQDK